VLTTGFDAPLVRAVVIGRPTASPILYEQMIGRGMRGPSFGGTEECLVIDVEDNIKFGGQMAYQRYAEYWVSRPATTAHS
jgi:superfamily II DNA or RNA helicase